MILRATFENIYSFKEETSISFVAGKGTVHPAHVSRAQKRDDISALKIISSSTPRRTVLVAAPESNECFFFDFKEDGTYTIYKQKAVHRNDADDEVVFEMDEESDGSIRLLDFIPMLIDLGQSEVDYMIDELDRSMHPLLSQKLIECYLHELSSGKDTQLIISTHECNLLNLDMIRSDEVWFVEKDKDGASRLVSLAEHKPRENVQKGYLQGRYSAIPFFAPIETLNKKSVAQSK